jgi:hypothetical protein
VLATLLLADVRNSHLAHTTTPAYVQLGLLDNQGVPHPALTQLLALLNVQHDGSLKSIVAATQAAWLRKPGLERWHMEELITTNKDEIILALDRLGYTKEVRPHFNHYHYAIVLGASITRVRLRLAYLIELWHQGIRFDSIVFLGGQRPLDPDIEPTAILMHNNVPTLPTRTDWSLVGELPKTEYDMIAMVIDQTIFPPDMALLPRVIIDAPMVKKTDGTLRRPDTNDTVSAWLSTNPTPGTCLCISNQPYIGHQDSTLRSVLPKIFHIDTVGSKMGAQEKISVVLDAIARWLYQEQQRRT